MFGIADSDSGDESGGRGNPLSFWQVAGLTTALFILSIIVAQFEPQLAPAKGTFPKFIVSSLNRIEPFGHGLGAALIVASAAIVSNSPFRSVWLYGAPPLAAGLVADLIKLFIARYRPGALGDSASSTDIRFLGFSDSIQSFLDYVTRSELHSFPSAHTAVAFGLALALSVFVGRGGVLFFSLASSVGFQRMVGGSHFPSDVLAGAGIGLLVGALMIHILQSWLTAPLPVHRPH
jgi:membrane-associated phospholipid phosphatase